MFSLLLKILLAAPFVFSVLIFIFRRSRKAIHLFFGATAFSHLILTVWVLLLFRSNGGDLYECGLIGLDVMSAVILAVTSILFFVVFCMAPRWVDAAYEVEGTGRPKEFERESVFFGCMSAFLGSMTLVLLSRDFGLMWVAVEATTLMSAPLIGFHRGTRSLEAMWKYLLICSVGIGFALFGTMLLAKACQSGTGESLGLSFASLEAIKSFLDPVWFKAAFVFALAGYGTKMGLAPFHTWLPDAHSEAPAIVSALLSGALLNCSFLGIYRFRSLAPAGMERFCDIMLIALGMCSLLTAVVFIIKQRDYKRMLAYSSVEHMGLVIIMLGLGMDTVLLLHIAGHSLIKMSLFFVAGEILFVYGTREVSAVHGILSKRALDAALWAIGILFICGAPPSPLFLSEILLIANAGPYLGGAVLLLLFVVFAGMTNVMVKMIFPGDGTEQIEPRDFSGRSFLSSVPASGFVFAAILGVVAFIYMISFGSL